LNLQKENLKNGKKAKIKKNFERKYILSIIFINKNEWLFAGIYKCLSIKEAKKESGKIYYIYKTELLEYGNELIGKLIINFEKDFRASYLLLENYINDLLLCEIKNRNISLNLFMDFQMFMLLLIY